MPKRDAAPLGAPCWVELFTSDTDKGRSFYGELFGWTSEDAGEEYGGYINFSKDGVRIAGCMRNHGEAGTPDLWSIYLATDDALKVQEAAVARGGTVIVPAMEVMSLGSMVVVTDPGGAAIGGWQSGEHRGFGLFNEPGTPSWFELHTRSYDDSIPFYEDVFKWDAHVMSDEPTFRYTTYGEGQDSLAGIMDASGFLPEGVPSHWSVYFEVEDVDTSLAKVAELGGSTVTPGEDTPYGRLATAVDPTGALFKLRTSPEA